MASWISSLQKKWKIAAVKTSYAIHPSYFTISVCDIHLIISQFLYKKGRYTSKSQIYPRFTNLGLGLNTGFGTWLTVLPSTTHTLFCIFWKFTAGCFRRPCICIYIHITNIVGAGCSVGVCDWFSRRSNRPPNIVMVEDWESITHAQKMLQKLRNPCNWTVNKLKFISQGNEIDHRSTRVTEPGRGKWGDVRIVEVAGGLSFLALPFICSLYLN